MELSISILQVEQVTQSYVDWYSNEEVVRYSDNQYRRFSFKGNVHMLKIASKMMTLTCTLFLMILLI